MKKNTKTLIAIAASVIIVGIIAGILLYRKFSPSNEHMALDKYFQAQQGEVTLVLGHEISESKGLYQDNELYLDLTLVKEKFNSRFYWDKNENLLLYTLPNAVASAEPGSKDYSENNSKTTLDYEIVRVDGDKVYVAIDYVKMHTDIEYTIEKNPARVVITGSFDTDARDFAKAEADCKLRYKADIKSDILVDIKQKTTLRILEEENKETGFCKVMEPTGVIGYVKAKELGKSYSEEYKSSFVPDKYSHILKDEPVCLVWHQVTNQTANSQLLNLLDATKGVNVVCPTWFETSDNKGSINSLASDDYVNKAHRAGVEVWGLCNDFSPDMKIGKVLECTSKRQKLAKNLVAEAIRYSLDGINIDFENVKQESGEDFVQFIRELSVFCRNNGIVLSVDNYPPMSYNLYYDRREQASVADYVITMAYDEYYAGSEEAGPVSSSSYVSNAIAALSKDDAEGKLEPSFYVPAEQSIIALPFYSRHWMEKTVKGKVRLSSEACSMKYTRELVEDSGKKAIWDEETGMNYLAYTEGKTLHKIWIEDAASLEVKLKHVEESGSAGVGFWKLGLEENGIWDTVIKYVK